MVSFLSWYQFFLLAFLFLLPLSLPLPLLLLTMNYLKVTGFFSPKDFYSLETPLGSELEWIFTLWTNTTPPRPVSCKMTNECYKSLGEELLVQDDLYDLTVGGHFLKYAFNGSLDSPSGSNTLVLVTEYAHLKPKNYMLTAMLITRNQMPIIHRIEHVSKNESVTTIIVVKLGVSSEGSAPESTPGSTCRDPVLVSAVISPAEEEPVHAPIACIRPTEFMSKHPLGQSGRMIGS
ncbi:hypothetical protein CLU79DRAFT_739997, partial [Phycomyces nitens]